jgi:hypothetical protein
MITTSPILSSLSGRGRARTQGSDARPGRHRDAAGDEGVHIQHTYFVNHRSAFKVLTCRYNGPPVSHCSLLGARCTEDGRSPRWRMCFASHPSSKSKD